MAGTVYKIGELIDNRYRVLSVLETGGMGVLYRVADETQDGQIIALKIVRVDVTGIESPESAARFQREFQILTQLHHPNLVSVYNYGITTGNDLYFTMEWAQGQSLDFTQQLNPAAVTPVIVQICRALAYLHARGVIHSDLKPGNVLLADGQVKLVDFGVSLEIRSPEARAHYYTPGYTAPEVKLLRAVDHRIDLYSLGALWYAMLMGEPPMFDTGMDRLVHFRLNEVLETQNEIPAEISMVIARLLATSPAYRYGSANQVIEAINRVVGGSYAFETRETARSYALRTHFVDRETESGILRNLWQQARTGEGQLVLIGGEAGVGKTRMVEEFEVQVELDGARVVWGQCVEDEGVAYRPWREVLRVLTRYVENGDEQVVQRVGPVLSALLPELWERPYMTGLAQPAELDPQAAQQRLNDAVVQVLRSAAGIRPTVVVIEDAHWADEATLALLTLLARIPKPANLLVCLTYRDGEIAPQHPLAVLRNNGTACFGVHTLPPEFTSDLARLMLGLDKLPPLLMERVQQVTGGNAFFTQELIRTLAEDGVVLQRTVEGWRVDEAALQRVSLPAGIQQVVEQRLARLSVEAQQALSWAAAMGTVSWEGGMAEVRQVARAQVRAAMRELVEQGLVVERDESAFTGEREYLFNSSTVREVSYEGIQTEERQAYHVRIADWLIAHSDEEVGEHLGLIADQLEKAGQIKQAVDYLRRAGEQAAAQFANAEAVNYLSHALELTPLEDQSERYNVLLAREKVYNLQGARILQKQDLLALEQLAQSLRDDRRQAEVSLRLSHYGEATGDYPAAIAAARTAISLAQTIQDAIGEAVGYQEWGRTLSRQGEYKAAVARLEQALTLAQAAEERRVEAESLLDIGYIYSVQGSYARARAYCEQALAICRATGDRRHEGDALNRLGIFAHEQGVYAGARAYYEQALCLFREIGFRRGEGIVLGNLARSSASLGDYAQAGAYNEQALHIDREIGNRESESLVLFSLSSLVHHLGDHKAAHKYSQQALSIAQEIGSRRTQGYALTSLGHALAGLGQLTEATETCQQALTLRHELGQHHLAMENRADLARISIAQGNSTQALAYVEEILGYLQDHTLDGTEEPFQIYLTCYHVLNAHHDPRAQVVLKTAYHLLQEQAAEITDAELCHSFLENVAAHRKIVIEFQARFGASSDYAVPL